MSVVILNPFNQILKFENGFLHEKDFSIKIFNFIYLFLKTCKENDSEDFLDLDSFVECEKISLIALFDSPIIDISHENADKFLNYLLEKYIIVNKENKSIEHKKLKNKILEDIKKEVNLTPYVFEKFFPFLINELKAKVSFQFVFQNIFDKCIFNFLFKIFETSLNNELINKIFYSGYDDYELFIRDLVKNTAIANSNFLPYIIICENSESYLKLCSIYNSIQTGSNNNSIPLELNNVAFFIFNFLLFSDTQIEYNVYKSFNINIVIEQKLKFDLFIESLMQTNLFIEFILKKSQILNEENLNSEYANVNKCKFIKDEFSIKNKKRVLYFFNEDCKSKSYRKRLLALSTEKIEYIPFITREFVDYKVFDSLYGNIDVLLQRAPYFYLASDKKKENCIKLEEYLSLRNHNTLKMSSFNIVEKLFFRGNCYSFIKNFIEKSEKITYEKFKIKTFVPYTIEFPFSQEVLTTIKYFIDNYNNADFLEKSKENLKSFTNDLIEQMIKQMKAEKIDFPVVIKPDECEVHEMFLVLAETGLNQFINFENFKKILKSKKYVIQKFINHDGLMFKNFFINKKSYTFIRPSLPNLEGKNLKIEHFKDNCFKFKNEFLYCKEDDSFWNNIENPDEKVVIEVNYEFIDYVSNLFAEYMDVNLFGLDYLFDKITKSYYILECNYFPSYRELKEKLQPEFENHIINYHNEFIK